MKAAEKARRSATAANRSSPGKRKPALSQQVALSLVMRYENPGQLTAPNQLSVGDDGSKVELPEKARVAVMKFPVGDDTAGRYGYYYWRQEEYVKTQQEYSDA